MLTNVSHFHVITRTHLTFAIPVEPWWLTPSTDTVKLSCTPNPHSSLSPRAPPIQELFPLLESLPGSFLGLYLFLLGSLNILFPLPILCLSLSTSLAQLAEELAAACRTRRKQQLVPKHVGPQGLAEDQKEEGEISPSWVDWGKGHTASL